MVLKMNDINAQPDDILIIDDVPDNLQLLFTMLIEQGYEVRRVLSAKQALKVIEIEPPDLILLDIKMPDLDGYELCKILKSQEKTKHIPIIFLSALNDTFDKVKAFEVGGVDYITKPFQLAEVVVRVENQLRLLKMQKEIEQKNNDLTLLNQKLEALNEYLLKQSNQDGLTQIANRRYFDTRLEEEWKRLQREKKPLSLILVDIDYFKKYNDYYGHLEGDECLKEIAKTLSNSVKRSMDLVARYGGEEFGIILPNTDKSGAIQIAEEIQTAISDLKIPHNPSCDRKYITVSLGITTIIPSNEYSIKNLISQADIALYQAKEKGRNQYCIY